MKHWSSLVVLGAALACAPSADNTDVSAQELLAAGADEFVVLDVRSASEFGSGHVPGARNIPHDELADRRGRSGGGRVLRARRPRRSGCQHARFRWVRRRAASGGGHVGVLRTG